MCQQQYISCFIHYLTQEEKSPATIVKYTREVQRFLRWLSQRELDKDIVVAYKKTLTQRYTPAGVNGQLTAVNVFLKSIGRPDCCVKLMKIQRHMFCQEERELSLEEYQRLLAAAGQRPIALVIRTICGTGIRVSELRHITVQAVQAGRAIVSCKSKTRVIFISSQLQVRLAEYAQERGITTGPVFVTRFGNPLDRSNIWRSMKSLCARANVSWEKVYPHTLRHLFARTYYTMEKDIVRLADLLGHSSVNTTRIYTISSGQEHRRQLEQMHLVL